MPDNNTSLLSTFDEMEIYDSGFAERGPHFVELIKKVANYSPTAFGWSEHKAGVNVDITADLLLDPLDEKISSVVGNHVLNTYTNAPDGLDIHPLKITVAVETLDIEGVQTMFTIASIQTPTGVLVNLRREGDNVSTTWDGPYLPNEKERISVGTEVGTTDTPTSTDTELLYVQKIANGAVPKAVVSGITHPIRPDGFMDAAVYDTQKVGSSPFEYLTDALGDFDDQYAEFVKHKSNTLPLIHVTAEQKADFDTKLTANELITLTDTAKTDIVASVETQYGEETAIEDRDAEVTASKTEIDAHIAAEVHVSSADLARWNAKAVGNHKHIKDTRVTIAGESIKSGFLHTDRLPSEIKERIIEISGLSILASSAITDEDRKVRYHNGNILVVSDLGGDYKKNRWYRVIDATKIGTADYAQGILEFTNSTDSMRLLWENISNRPTNATGFGINDEVNVKTEVDTLVNAVKTTATAQKASIEGGLGKQLTVLQPLSTTDPRICVGYLQNRLPRYAPTTIPTKAELLETMGQCYSGERTVETDLELAGAFYVWNASGRLKEIYPSYMKNGKYLGIFASPYLANDVDPITVQYPANTISKYSKVYPFTEGTTKTVLELTGFAENPNSALSMAAAISTKLCTKSDINNNYLGVLTPRIPNGTIPAQDLELRGFAADINTNSVFVKTEWNRCNTVVAQLPGNSNTAWFGYDNTDGRSGTLVTTTYENPNINTYMHNGSTDEPKVHRIIGSQMFNRAGVSERSVMVTETGNGAGYVGHIWISNNLVSIYQSPPAPATPAFHYALPAVANKSLVKAVFDWIEGIGPVIGLTYANIDATVSPVPPISGPQFMVVTIKSEVDLSQGFIVGLYPGLNQTTFTMKSGMCIGVYGSEAFANSALIVASNTGSGSTTAMITHTDAGAGAWTTSISQIYPGVMNTAFVPYEDAGGATVTPPNYVLFAITKAEGLYVAYGLKMRTATTVEYAQSAAAIFVSTNGINNWVLVEVPKAVGTAATIAWSPTFGYNSKLREIWFARTSLQPTNITATDSLPADLTITRYSIDYLWNKMLRNRPFTQLRNMTTTPTSVITPTTVTKSIDGVSKVLYTYYLGALIGSDATTIMLDALELTIPPHPLTGADKCIIKKMTFRHIGAAHQLELKMDAAPFLSDTTALYSAGHVPASTANANYKAALGIT